MIRRLYMGMTLTVCLFASLAIAQDVEWVESVPGTPKQLQKQYNEYMKSYHWALDQGAYNKFIGDQEANYFEQVGKLQPSPYWVGVQCEPAGETKFYSKQIGGLVSVKGGLKISHISENSPASQADFEVGDVILFIENKMVSDVEELVSVVGEKKENPIRGALVRDEKIVEFKVTPAKRPTPKKVADLNRLPGQNATLSWVYDSGIPKGYSATINVAHGEKPEVVINKGDESWSTDDGDVSDLPKETRAFARSAYRAFTPPNYGQFGHGWWGRAPGNQNEFIPANKWMVEKGQGIDQRFDRLQKQLEALAKAVNELKNKED